MHLLKRPHRRAVSLPGGTDSWRAALKPAPCSLAQSRVSARIQMCQGRLNEMGLLPLLCLCQPWLSACRLSNGRSREPTPSAVSAGISFLDFLSSLNPQETEVSPPHKGSHG